MSKSSDPRARGNSWYVMAQDHSRAKQDAEAIAAYSKAIELAPDHTKARCGRGLALQRIEDHEAALRDFEDVIQRVPQWAGIRYAYYSRAYSYRALGRLTEAISDCNQSLQKRRWQP